MFIFLQKRCRFFNLGAVIDACLKAGFSVNHQKRCNTLILLDKISEGSKINRYSAIR